MLTASASVVAVPCLGAVSPAFAQHLGERAAVLGQVDGLGRGAHHRHPGGLERPGQPERRLPAELHDHAFDRPALPLRADHLEHVLQGERLEVQPARGVVVGGDGLRVAVDHHGLVARVGERERRVHAGVVELDALADPVRPAAEDDHLRRAALRHLGLVVVGRVEVRRARRELGGAGVHRVVHRPHPEAPADLADDGLGGAAQLGDLRVGEAVLLGRGQRAARPAPGACRTCSATWLM